MPNPPCKNTMINTKLEEEHNLIALPFKRGTAHSIPMDILYQKVEWSTNFMFWNEVPISTIQNNSNTTDKHLFYLLIIKNH